MHNNSLSAPDIGRRIRWRGVLAIAVLTLMSAGIGTQAVAERPHVYAITRATVLVSPSQRLEQATVIVRDGLIERVGRNVQVPADAELIDGDGLTVYAGWIDAYSHLAMQKPRASGGGGRGFNLAALLQPRKSSPGTGHPIELVHPQYRVTSELISGDAEIKRRREMGFTAALAVPRAGVFRGWSALIALRDAAPRELVIEPTAAQHVGFDHGQFLSGYPSDLLGAIATIRQVSYDVSRYVEWKRRFVAHPRGMQRPEYNDAFEALAGVASSDTPIFVHAGSNRAIERALRLGQELGIAPVILGSGFEYEMLDVLRGTDSVLLVPVKYPDKPDVSKPERLPSVTLESLERWEKAPGNAAALEQAGIRFALTPYGMSNAGKFTENVRKAIEAGLSEQTALAALTTIPAQLLGVGESLGTIEAGKIANLVVATGEPFAEGTEIRHVFVDGRDYEIEAKKKVGNPSAVVDPRGEWAVTVTVMGNTQNATWTIEGSEGNYHGRSVSDQGQIEFESVALEGNALTVVIVSPMGRLEATVVIEGDEFTGSASIPGPGGQSVSLSFHGERVSGPQGGVR